MEARHRFGGVEFTVTPEMLAQAFRHAERADEVLDGLRSFLAAAKRHGLDDQSVASLLTVVAELSRDHGGAAAEAALFNRVYAVVRNADEMAEGDGGRFNKPSWNAHASVVRAARTLAGSTAMTTNAYNRLRTRAEKAGDALDELWSQIVEPATTAVLRAESAIDDVLLSPWRHELKQAPNAELVTHAFAEMVDSHGHDWIERVWLRAKKDNTSIRDALP